MKESVKIVQARNNQKKQEGREKRRKESQIELDQRLKARELARHEEEIARADKKALIKRIVNESKNALVRLAKTDPPYAGGWASYQRIAPWIKGAMWYLGNLPDNVTSDRRYVLTHNARIERSKAGRTYWSVRLRKHDIDTLNWILDKVTALAVTSDES